MKNILDNIYEMCRLMYASQDRINEIEKEMEKILKNIEELGS